MMVKVYIAGPYTKGDVAENVYNAIKAGDRLLELGYIPFVPHLTHFWHIVSQKDWETWLMIDREFLLVCDCLLRLPGESKGADIEFDIAREKGIRVFFGIESLDAFYRWSNG